MVNPSFLDLKSGIRKKVSTSFRICRPVTSGFGVQFQPDLVSSSNRILHYYRARYYDAKVGRFLSEDSIGFDSGDLNLYRYVRNNPVNYVDWLGLALDTPYPTKAICVQECIGDSELNASCGEAYADEIEEACLMAINTILGAVGAPLGLPKKEELRKNLCNTLCKSYIEKDKDGNYWVVWKYKLPGVSMVFSK